MILYVFFVCLCASTIGGICGIGGGIVIKPLLDATGLMSISTVSFLSGLTVLAMSLVSVYKNRRTKELDAARSIPLGVGAAIGGVMGKRIFDMLKASLGADQLLGTIQALVLGVLVLATLIYQQNRTRIPTKNVASRPLSVLIGLLLGLFSSFLGIGGGPMNLAVLFYFFSMGTKAAAVNSLLIVLISQSVSVMMTLLGKGVPAFELPVLLAMVSAGILGGLISARLHKKLSAKATDKLFCALLVVILAICVFNACKGM
ncbi:MAG: sulfite exporter TauE/SafE family protein [Clostridia bacterium]|nr:sulfite exporter TauE/SafE family protein [Clostridia bacterium]